MRNLVLFLLVVVRKTNWTQFTSWREGVFFLSRAQPKSYRFDENIVVILQLVSLGATLEILRFYEVRINNCARLNPS